MSVKKAYAKFKKGVERSAFGIKATTVGKDYGLGDSMFNKGKVIKKNSKSDGSKQLKGPGASGKAGGVRVESKPKAPSVSPPTAQQRTP